MLFYLVLYVRLHLWKLVLNDSRKPAEYLHFMKLCIRKRSLGFEHFAGTEYVILSDSVE